MAWTPKQLQAITQKGSNILVAAAAGSGKTAVLVERIINKIMDDNESLLEDAQELDIYSKEKGESNDE